MCAGDVIGSRPAFELAASKLASGLEAFGDDILAMNGESYRLAQSAARRRLATKAAPTNVAAGNGIDPDIDEIPPG